MTTWGGLNVPQQQHWRGRLQMCLTVNILISQRAGAHETALISTMFSTLYGRSFLSLRLHRCTQAKRARGTPLDQSVQVASFSALCFSSSPETLPVVTREQGNGGKHKKKKKTQNAFTAAHPDLVGCADVWFGSRWKSACLCVSPFVCLVCWTAYPGMQNAVCFLLALSDLAPQYCFLASIIDQGSGAKWHLNSLFVNVSCILFPYVCIYVKTHVFLLLYTLSSYMPFSL